MQTIEAFMWIVTIASLVGTIANLYKRAWCFNIWLFCNVAWCVYDIDKQAYPQAFLMGAYAVLAVWGIIEWGKDKTPEKGVIKRFKKCKKKPLTSKHLRATYEKI